ncbi:MAG: hypothetical protein ACPGVU_15070 [Limisphaerales bacterium]
MKNFARIGAVLTFGSFLIVAFWFFNQAPTREDAMIPGFGVLGSGIFLGTNLWLKGEQFRGRENTDS